MKKIIIFLAALAFVVSAFAQGELTVFPDWLSTDGHKISFTKMW